MSHFFKKDDEEDHIVSRVVWLLIKTYCCDGFDLQALVLLTSCDAGALWF